MTTAFDRCEPAGSGPNKFLVRHEPIQTMDAALFGRERSVRGARTRDDVLTGPEPEKRISLGSAVWTGNDGDALVDLANYNTAAFAAGCFAPDRPLEAEDLDDYISRTEAHAAQMKDIRAKLAARDNDPNAAGDIAPHELTADARTSSSGLFDPSRTAAFAALRKDKAAPVSQPATVDHAGGLTRGQRTLFGSKRTADYAATMAAARAAKGAA